MSTRSVKKTTTTTSRVSASQREAEAGPSTPRTPESGYAGSPRSRGSRPPSPTMISRLQEKAELAGLNDRLATYIDRVRQLEHENRQLTTQVRTQEETVTREVTNIKALYERELADARKLLDEISKEKAKLQIEVGKYKQEAQDWKDKFHKADRELKSVEKKLLTADATINDLQARLNDAINQRKHWESEYNKARVEIAQLEKQLANAQKQLEEETIARVDLENRVQSLKEELNFKNQVHEQELNETRTRVDTTFEEVDGKLKADYESRLRDALQSMRVENEYNIRTTREETEELFMSKLDNLKKLAGEKDNLAQATWEELRSYRKRVDDLATENGKLKSEIAGYETRIAELEDQLEKLRMTHESAIGSRDAEIRRLRLALEEQLTEYRDLMDVKIALDMEISAYRKLLESEETRLNISQTEEITTPRRGTPVRQMASRKRKRGLDSGYATEYQSRSGFESKSSSKGAVEISETDEEGAFIKLHNTGDKEMALGSWQLKHVAGDKETTYKFHRSVHIKPDDIVTVYTSESDVTHSPSDGELVMKAPMKWYIADNMTSTLIDNKGNEMASREMTKQLLRTTTTYTRSSRLDSGLGEDGRDEKCSIM